MRADAIGYAQFSTIYQDGQPVGARCDHADPRIRISVLIVEAWHGADNMAAAFVGTEHHPPVNVQCMDAATCPVGDVVILDCEPRRLVYRITGREGECCYIAEWPD